jgi:hypothetical protein
LQAATAHVSPTILHTAGTSEPGASFSPLHLSSQPWNMALAAVLSVQADKNQEDRSGTGSFTGGSAWATGLSLVRCRLMLHASRH